ncbi:MAG: hypothetical protein ABFS45_22550 [Pseudomonadota bacterium]
MPAAESAAQLIKMEGSIMFNKLHILITAFLIVTSTQLAAEPPINPPPIEVDAFVVNDKTNPIPVEVVNASAEYQFAGYTEQETEGNTAGYSGMNAICQQEFGENARMCTTKEWFNTHGTSVPPQDEDAWVQPVLVSSFYNHAFDLINWTDWTGAGTRIIPAAVPQNFASCNQWTNNRAEDGLLGFVVSRVSDPSDEPLEQVDCSVPNRVTCCTPPR